MPRLRITQSNGDQGRHRVDLEFEVEKRPRQTATSLFDFALSEPDQADLRWYLEEYLQFRQDPAPTIAARVETQIAEIGKDLFVKVFHSSDDARDLWAKLREKLDDTHVEVVTSVEGATTIPWELIRDPKTDVPLALRAAVFARAHPQPAQAPRLRKTKSGPIRILLVICRPRADDDVPFRSVASRLIKGLSEQNQANYQLDVLRPPTFERLAKVLRRAKQEKKPYHVVHFDGHGMYAELTDEGGAASILQHLFPVIFSARRTGRHGFLVFENPRNPENAELIDGPTLGSLLVETGVPVLVLNACRSAHAEGEVDEAGADETTDGTVAPPQTQAPADPHERVRALGSLAQEVMDAGVAGVVAMRYNVYVVTAARFVADLYAELVRGQTLGAAVTMGRKQLAANPDRTIAFDPLPLQDWCVPIVYESMPIGLFPTRQQDAGLTIAIQAGDTVSTRGAIDSELPRPPDAGFFGRDETLLALDRAFDTQPIVLLHAYAGSGKTSTAAEFARWYSQTGGVDGPVLFTSFEQHRPLPRVLDRIGEVFGAALEKSDIHWLALNEVARRSVALQVLKQKPVLWIWDNVEPVAGFPKGTPSAWSDAEERELADFLRDARSTKARFLLTSRREEQDWLGDIPARIQVPVMPMQERVQLAQALAEKRGRRITDVADWRPLLRFTDGNPLTISVLVGQALRDGLRTREQIEKFVTELRAGTAKFDDEASEGRTRSLGASLSYGFDHAFSEDERKQLALLHFFQGFVDVDALKWMGNPEAEWGLPELRGLTRDVGIGLLDRAAEVGLLTSLGNGYYTIHPAIPWFFKSLFDTYYSEPTAGVHGDDPDGENSRSEGAVRAFVEAIGRLGDYYTRQYVGGHREVIAVLVAEEANLLHARRLARQNAWWRPVISSMQGIRNLYDHTGRMAEFKRLVDELVPDFVDPAGDGPLAGREDDWNIVTSYRVRLALQMRDWATAERLQRLQVDRSRRSVGSMLDRHCPRKDHPIASDESEALRSEHRTPPPSEQAAIRHRLATVLPGLPDADRNTVRSLAVSLDELGGIQRGLMDASCIASYEEAFNLAELLGDRTSAAISALHLGHAYLQLDANRDLNLAELWYRRSADLSGEHDRLGRARALGQLGLVAWERFKEARDAGEPDAALRTHLNAALEAYHGALDLIPQDAVGQLAVGHNQLGLIYVDAREIDRALRHYRESIHYEELQGNTYGAAQTCGNVAIALARYGRLEDAREYAIAALNRFTSYGADATEGILQAQELIDRIDKAIAGKHG